MKLIDYFAPLDPLTDLLQRIKGELRRQFVEREALAHGLHNVPEVWCAQDLSEAMKNLLQEHHPRMRGGEDLPDLKPGEVEIARLVLLDSVHGEVTSLRARRLTDGELAYIMVDEYGTDFKLPIPLSSDPLTVDEVLDQFRDSDPSPMDTDCSIGLRSVFYSDLEEPALRLANKKDDSGDNADDEKE